MQYLNRISTKVLLYTLSKQYGGLESHGYILSLIIRQSTKMDSVNTNTLLEEHIRSLCEKAYVFFLG